jgi:hypothetical protein
VAHPPVSPEPPASSDDRPDVLIGLLADPNLPAKIAQHLADDLPGTLAERVSDKVRWQVESVHEPFEVATGYKRVIDKARARVTGTNWDIAVCITDIPMETTNGTVVADVSLRDRVALVSLPALGGMRLRRRIRDVAAAIISQLAAQVGQPQRSDDSQMTFASSALGSRLSRRVTPVDGDVDIELVMPQTPGALRLLAGTVRANRPWQLAVGLSKALAGAAAGSAFGIIYSAIWKLATVLEPWRLATGTVAAIAALVVWLVAGHSLWQHHPGPPRLRTLLNIATVLTIVCGVVVFYVALSLLNLIAAALIIPPPYFAEVVGRPVEVTDYLRVTVMASGMGTVAGAVGSGLEDDATVRMAAYRTREQQRRAQISA